MDPDAMMCSIAEADVTRCAIQYDRFRILIRIGVTASQERGQHHLVTRFHRHRAKHGSRTHSREVETDA
jgi:hypothetical protein